MATSSSSYKTIKRHITFDTILIKRAERRARQYGVSFPEYIRHLVIDDTKPLVDKEIEMITDPELEESIGKSLEDVKAGRVKEITNVDDFIDNL